MGKGTGSFIPGNSPQLQSSSAAPVGPLLHKNAKKSHDTSTITGTKENKRTKSKPGHHRHRQVQDSQVPLGSPEEPHLAESNISLEELSTCDILGDGIEENTTTRDNIRVLVRIRPKNDTERNNSDAKTIVKAVDSNSIIFDPKQETVDFFFHGVKHKVHDFSKRPNKNLRFTFDHVFSPTHSNVEIFEDCLKSIVNHVIRGFNCSVFAYGATGSGKTYTMLGSAENPGLTFLMAKELSRRIKEMANEFEAEIVVSYLEIYNETIKDLLYPSGTLSIREDGLNGVNIPNLTMHKIQDTCDLLRMLSQGNAVRTQHPTDHNEESSRSHAVFQVFVSLRRRVTRLSLNYKMAKAKLVMVDLAGSERGSTSNPDNHRCREGANINKSLLALGNCINALADGKKHIPYRDSKLTRLLKDSLGGNCKTVMIANVAPTVLNYDDTYNTLRYADRAKEIRLNYRKNIVNGPSITSQQMINELQSEITKLKTLLQKEKDTNMNLLTEQQQQVRGNLTLGCISSHTSSLLSSQQQPLIHDPAALENFFELLGQKKKLEETHVDASVKAKEAEWSMMWKKWRISSLSHLSPPEKAKTNSTTNTKSKSSQKLTQQQQQSSMEKLKSQCESLTSKYNTYQEQVGLSKRLVDFNDKEIECIGRNFLNNLRMDDPFLTVTLSEFLYYKTLEREVATHKTIENYHHTMCTRIFDELVKSEVVLSDGLTLMDNACKKSIPLRETKYKEILNKFFNENGVELSKQKSKTLKKNAFPSEELLKNLWQVVRNPVVEYEPPSVPTAHTANTAEDQQNQRMNEISSCSSKTSIRPIQGSLPHTSYSTMSSNISPSETQVLQSLALNQDENNNQKKKLESSESCTTMTTASCSSSFADENVVTGTQNVPPSTGESRTSKPFSNISSSINRTKDSATPAFASRNPSGIRATSTKSGTSVITDLEAMADLIHGTIKNRSKYIIHPPRFYKKSSPNTPIHSILESRKLKSSCSSDSSVNEGTLPKLFSRVSLSRKSKNTKTANPNEIPLKPVVESSDLINSSGTSNHGKVGSSNNISVGRRRKIHRTSVPHPPLVVLTSTIKDINANIIKPPTQFANPSSSSTPCKRPGTFALKKPSLTHLDLPDIHSQEK